MCSEQTFKRLWKTSFQAEISPTSAARMELIDISAVVTFMPASSSYKRQRSKLFHRLWWKRMFVTVSAKNEDHYRQHHRILCYATEQTTLMKQAVHFIVSGNKGTDSEREREKLHYQLLLFTSVGFCCIDQSFFPPLHWFFYAVTRPP